MKDDKGLTCQQLGEAVAAIVEAKVEKAKVGYSISESGEENFRQHFYDNLTESDWVDYQWQNKTGIYEKFFKEYANLHSIDRVEVMATGTWKGDPYTEQDLDNMVSAFNDLSFKPRLKLDHGSQKIADGLPALGYVSKLWREGKKLVASFVDIPKTIYELIKNKAYNSVSSEVWFNRVFEGKVRPRVLTAVAFLGDKLPAVDTLKDISAMYSLPGEGGELRAYSVEDYEPEKDYSAKINIKASLDALRALVKAGKLGKLKENQLADPSAIWSGVGGSFTSCVSTLEGKSGITDAKALCAWLHHEAEGTWPAESSKQTKNTEEDNTMNEEQKKEMEDLKAKNAELEKTVEEKDKETESFKAEMAKKEEAVRKEKRDTWLEKYSTGDDIKIAPVEKPIVEFLMETLDSGNEDVKKLSLEKEELTPIQAFQKLFEKRAGLSGILRELSTSDATHKGEGAIGLDEEVALYMKENDDKTYADAVAFLQMTKPELFKDYARPESE